MRREYWEALGADYDGEIFDVYREDRRGLMGRMIRRHLPKGVAAGDFGCGTGKGSVLLAGRCSSLECLDISESFLAQARKRLADFDRVSFRHCDLSCDGDDGPPLDFALCVNVLIMESLETRIGILRTIHRRLKPGGVLLLVVPSMESALYSAARMVEWNLRDGMEGTNALQRMHCTMGGRCDRVEDGLVEIDGVPTKHFLEPELEAMADRYGFRVRSCKRVEYGWHTEFENPPDWMKSPYPWDWLAVWQKASELSH